MVSARQTGAIMTTILNPKVKRIRFEKTGSLKKNLTLNLFRQLNGKTIGFLDNGKKNFDAYLDHTEQLLRKNFTFTSFRRRKPVP
jgi:hypothetical protein